MTVQVFCQVETEDIQIVGLDIGRVEIKGYMNSNLNFFPSENKRYWKSSPNGCLVGTEDI